MSTRTRLITAIGLHVVSIGFSVAFLVLIVRHWSDLIPLLESVGGPLWWILVTGYLAHGAYWIANRVAP